MVLKSQISMREVIENMEVLFNNEKVVVLRVIGHMTVVNPIPGKNRIESVVHQPIILKKDAIDGIAGIAGTAGAEERMECVLILRYLSSRLILSQEPIIH
ncbi:hypothetical protein HHI36_023034 [Cryptolaemus montrouzieri]|uniref:Uncharacterized protein n=1 Tax=Cryptolaemus montrouzieri TaxID=559131 RepID=A0ABD2PF46_9CUCU